MPVITPVGIYKEELANIVNNMESVLMVFRSNKLETFVIPPRLGTFSIRLIFGNGIDKPQTIALFIEIQPKPNEIADDQFNISIFNVPTAHQVDVKKIATTFNDKIITTDSVNNFLRNVAARWYNDFKNFWKSYYGYTDEDSLVDSQDYVNLLSKQPEITIYGTANIRLDFKLNKITPQNYTTTVYALSFFDRMFMLKSDGTKQYVVQEFSVNKWKKLSVN